MSNAATGGEFVGVIAILCIFGMPIAYAMVNRVYAHRERMEMIRQGIAPPLDSRAARRAARAGYDPFTYSQRGVSAYDTDALYPDRMLRKGVMIAMIGSAILIAFSIIDPGPPGPRLLFGLIPLFVGLAQIILALMSGATFAGWRVGVPPASMYPPPGERPTPAPPQGPYAWRPGPATELEPPVRPPDVKQ